MYMKTISTIVKVAREKTVDVVEIDFFSCFLCWGARMIDIHQHIPHFHFDYLVLFDDFFSLSVLTVIFNTVPVEQNNTASFRVSLKSAVQNSHRHSRGHVIKTHHEEKTCSRWMTIMLNDNVKERWFAVICEDKSKI